MLEARACVGGRVAPPSPSPSPSLDVAAPAPLLDTDPDTWVSVDPQGAAAGAGAWACHAVAKQLGVGLQPLPALQLLMLDAESGKQVDSEVLGEADRWAGYRGGVGFLSGDSTNKRPTIHGPGSSSSSSSSSKGVQE